MRLEEYQNFRLGKADVFQGVSETAKSAEAELKNLDDNIERLEGEYAELINERDLRSAGSRLAVLTEEMIDQYIERIEVYDEQNIEIFWKEKGNKGAAC